ncbi:MAG: hypothetical protein OQK32_00225 [Gammaproteobacteria bacterium]|nr:hypothetical protein [Gammaproteobacteria bacterium]MCW8922360.1 hypothetical protein [Gammaproteobacteria bacterium]
MAFSEVTRKQAFLTHLAASTCVFVIISYLIIFHWFPEFYFYLDGGIRAITTIFFVDVILGPGLTLLVFTPGKKSLKFDMAVILLLQLSALSWGINSVYTERSGATVFYFGKFSCKAHSDTGNMDMNLIVKGPSGQQRLSFLQRPDTIDEFMNFTKEAYNHQSSEIYYYPEKIVPLDEIVVRRLQNYQLNLSELAEESEKAAKMVEDYLGRNANDVKYINLVPLACRYGSAIAIYDIRELKITDWIKVKTKLRGKAQDEPLPLKSVIQN